MFQLIDLPYAVDALEPVISARTLEFHHGKHLQAYVDNLNRLLPGSGQEDLPLEEIVRKAPAGPIFNNAGQILNHNLYFTQFRPSVSSSTPTVIPSEAEGSPLTKQIISQGGSFDSFQSDFEARGAELFGSGWVWLQADEKGALSIGQYPGADNPVAHGLRPLLTFDVWEHAYYLDYQNRRPAHLKALWAIVDWNVINARYDHQ